MTTTTTAGAFAALRSLAANLHTDLSPAEYVARLIADAAAEGTDPAVLAACTEVVDAARFGKVWVPELHRVLRDFCPDCGAKVARGYAPNPGDPGDVDPTAECTACGWGY